MDIEIQPITEQKNKIIAKFLQIKDALQYLI